MTIDKGNTNAMNSYATMLQYGQGVAVDYKEAIKIYKEFISRNNADAMLAYGKILLGASESEEKAKEGLDIISRAANRGLGEAFYEYGRIIEERNREDIIQLIELFHVEGLTYHINW